MPTYEFACPAGHRFDRFFRKISESTPTLPCPECGAEAVRQLSAGAGLIFKGSGFYITDYGKDGKKAPPAAGKPGQQEGKGEKGGKGDAAGAKPDGGASPDAAKGKPAAPGGGTGSSSGGSSSE